MLLLLFSCTHLERVSGTPFKTKSSVLNLQSFLVSIKLRSSTLGQKIVALSEEALNIFNVILNAVSTTDKNDLHLHRTEVKAESSETIKLQ